MVLTELAMNSFEKLLNLKQEIKSLILYSFGSSSACFSLYNFRNLNTFCSVTRNLDSFRNNWTIFDGNFNKNGPVINLFFVLFDVLSVFDRYREQIT